MRRALWIVVGLALVSLFFAYFGEDIRNEAVPAVQIPQSTPVERTLPCKIEGTELTAQNLAVYDGPFMEDGSGDEVIGVTALVLHNDTNTFLEWGEVELATDSTTLCFRFTALAPDATILIPEKNRSEERPESFLHCSGTVQTIQQQPIGKDKIRIAEVDLTTLSLTNQDLHAYEDIRIYYKRYDTPSQMYIGGNTYTAQIGLILPGQTVCVSPYRFVRGYSRVVTVLPEA